MRDRFDAFGKNEEQVEIEWKYEGYLRRQEAEVNGSNRWKKSGFRRIFPTIGAGVIKRGQAEAGAVRPVSIGQASRIPGITPAAISILLVFLKRFRDLSSKVESAA